MAHNEARRAFSPASLLYVLPGPLVLYGDEFIRQVQDDLVILYVHHDT